MRLTKPKKQNNPTRCILAALCLLTAVSTSANNGQTQFTELENGVSDKIEGTQQKQARRITGKVVDQNGEPIIGATIRPVGSSTGTVTDADGNFTINVVPGRELQISSIGFRDEIVRAAANMNVVLKNSEEALDEVVVVGYGTQKKVNLSGSVASLDTKKLESRPLTNVGQSLQGAIANLNVTVSSGSAATNPSYNIRGYTSLNGGSPLIVIDGVIADATQLNRMNPNDIENLSVLKDAASSAIYGSRAAYGVILVTTKQGKSEKVTVNYNGSYVWRKLTRLPKIITDPYAVCTTRNICAYPWYNLYNEQMLAIAKGRSEDPDNTPLYYEDPVSGNRTYFGETDWVKEAYKDTGFSTIQDISLSGKSDKINYWGVLKIK